MDMNLNHLKDDELVQYIIKHDNDPIRIRLAKYMDDMPGFILDSLEHAGMDPETCLFDNGLYDPGQYIRHLENEIEFLQNELSDALDKIREREALTVSELLEEMLNENRRLQIRIRNSDEDRRKAEAANELTQSKMKVWRAISTDL